MKLLKLSGIMAMLMCLFVFNSCSDDDDENNNAGDLIGTWQSERRIYWEKNDGVMDSGDSEEWEDYTRLKLVFAPDGTVSSYDYDSYNDDWEFDGSMNYRYEDGKLYLSNPEYPGQAGFVKVLTLTSSVLEIEESEKQSYQGHSWELYSRIVLRKI